MNSVVMNMRAIYTKAYTYARKLANELGSILALLSGIGLTFIMLGTVLDVVVRDFYGRSLAGMDAMAEVGLAFVVFLGLMGAQASGIQIATPILTNRLPSRAGHAIRALAAWLVALITFWMTVETTRAAYQSWQIKEFRFGLANVPVWPARCAIPIGLACLIIALIIQGVDHAAKFKRGEPKETITYEEY